MISFIVKNYLIIKYFKISITGGDNTTFYNTSILKAKKQI